MKKIVICDDEPERVSQWIAALQLVPDIGKSYEIGGLQDGALEEGVKELSHRRNAQRENRTIAENRGGIDDAAILIVDYDLPKLPELVGSLTGEWLAYLARSYSSCGIIVAMNQFKSDNPFDLTLRDHPDSFADLNIGSSQLGNRGLWGREWTGFRPWAWPVLPELEEMHSSRVRDVLRNLDQSIVEVLNISGDIQDRIPPDAREFLASSTELSAVTFREVATSSEQGLKAKDRQGSDEALARIAASRVSRWIECYLLPSQDILVDAPHLASRFPSLIGGASAGQAQWDSTCFASSAEATGIASAIQGELFNPQWASRPCWNWAAVSRDEQVQEVKDPWTSERGNLAFAEDLSRFIPADAAREFVAAFDSPFSRRFLARPDSDLIGEETKREIAQVDYRPKARLYV